jgi:hypothetical protein
MQPSSGLPISSDIASCYDAAPCVERLWSCVYVAFPLFPAARMRMATMCTTCQVTCKPRTNAFTSLIATCTAHINTHSRVYCLNQLFLFFLCFPIVFLFCCHFMLRKQTDQTGMAFN